jgi:hypothetical protein
MSVEEEILKEALTIIKTAEQKGINPVRLLGAVAFKLRIKKYADFYTQKLDRRLTDIDLITLSYNMKNIKPLLNSLGYRIMFNPIGIKRETYQKKNIKVDVFYDELNMCHKLDLKNRLNTDPLTISISDLLLQKLQIINITDKDVKDVIALLLEYDIGFDDDNKINGDYIAQVLSKDWGFCHTVCINLSRIRDLGVKRFHLQESQLKVVNEKIDQIIKFIQEKPKSISWKLRAILGEKIKWYNEVEEVERDKLREVI